MVSFALLSLLFLIFLFGLSFTLLKMWQRFKTRDIASSNDLSKVIETLPPVFLELLKMEANTWQNQKLYKQDSELLKRAGFEHEEDALTFHSGVHIHRSFWKHPKSQIAVILTENYSPEDVTHSSSYQHDICLKGKSSFFTLSNSMNSALIPRPKHMPLALQHGKTLQQLLTGLKSAIPKGFAPVRFNTTKALFQSSAEELAIWLYQKPQLSSDKMAVVLEPLKIEMNDELLAQLVDFGREQSSEYYSQKVVQHLRQRTKIKPAQWQAMSERLVVIHDKMTSQHVCDALYQLFSFEQLTALETLLETKKLELPLLEPFELLQHLVQQLTLTLPKAIAQLEQPVKAQVFLGPP